MDELLQYETRLKIHNWNYQNARNAIVWRDGHKEFENLIAISYKSNAHREIFNRYKRRFNA